MNARLTYKNFLAILAVSAGLLILPVTSFAQQMSGGGATCSKDSGCNNSTCKIDTNANGIMNKNSKNVRDTKCVINNAKENASSNCFDPMPMEKAPSVNIAALPGSRGCDVGSASAQQACRESGQGARNHYGADYGTGGVSGLKAYAAADGVIKECRLSNGAGRMIRIEHEKQCQCTPGNAGSSNCETKWSTVYLHLAAWADGNGNVTTGQKSAPAGCIGRKVKKGDVIGIVGGSNYSPLVENGYAIHLHLEVHGGSDKFGSQSLKNSTMDPTCDNIQSFCGSCPTDISEQCEEKSTPSSAGGSAGGGNPSGGSTPQANTSQPLDKCYLSQYMLTECLFCPLFEVLFNTASTVALKAYNALASGVANVVMMVFALWLCVTVLKYIASFEVKDPRKMLQEIIIQAFRVLIVWIILHGSYFQVMQLTMEPVFNTGMKFVQAVTSFSGECSEGSGIIGYDGSFEESARGGLPTSMGKNILCTLKSIQDAVNIMLAYGRQAICLSWKDPFSWLAGLMPNFALFYTGLFLCIGALVLLLAFPWCLIDCVLNMCLAAGLAPAAIGAWAFKATGQYLKKIWNFFMNAMFNFVFLGIIIFVITQCVVLFMEDITNHEQKDTVNMFVDPINGLAFWGIKAVQLVVICLMGYVFLDEGKNFARRFANAKGADVGRSVGGAFAQAAKRAGSTGLKVGKAVGKTAGEKAADVGDKYVGEWARKKVNQFRTNRTLGQEVVGAPTSRNIFNRFSQSLQGKGHLVTDKDGNPILDENGNKVYERTRRSILTGFRETTDRVTVDADGNMTWSREVQKHRTSLGNYIRGIRNRMRLNNIRAGAGTDANGNPIDNTYSFQDNGDGTFTESRTIHPWYRFGKGVTLTAITDAEGNLISMNREQISRRMQVTSAGLAWASSTLDNTQGANSKVAQAAAAASNFVNSHQNEEAENLDKSQASKTFSSDQFMSVRQTKDRNGNIVGEETQFNIREIKKLINQDGTLNQQLVDRIVNNSKFDKGTVYRALANEVMKQRGINMPNNFTDRKIIYKENVILIEQNNTDGSKTELAMEIGGQNQMLIDIKTSYSDGSYSRIVDNGVMRKNINFNSKDDQAVVSYKFADIYYRQKAGVPLDKFGNFGGFVNVHAAMYGFSGQDRALHAQQVATGKNATIDAKVGGQQFNSVSQVEAQRRAAEERAQQQAQEEARQKAEEEARQKAEEEAKRKAEEAHQNRYTSLDNVLKGDWINEKLSVDELAQINETLQTVTNHKNTAAVIALWEDKVKEATAQICNDYTEIHSIGELSAYLAIEQHLDTRLPEAQKLRAKIGALKQEAKEILMQKRVTGVNGKMERLKDYEINDILSHPEKHGSSHISLTGKYVQKEMSGTGSSGTTGETGRTSTTTGNDTRLADRQEAAADKREEAEARRDEAADKREEAEARRDEAADKREEAGARRDEAADKREEAEARRDEAVDKREEAEARRDEAVDKREEAEARRDEAADKREEAEARRDEAERKAQEEEKDTARQREESEREATAQREEAERKAQEAERETARRQEESEREATAQREEAERKAQEAEREAARRQEEAEREASAQREEAERKAQEAERETARRQEEAEREATAQREEAEKQLKEEESQLRDIQEQTQNAEKEFSEAERQAKEAEEELEKTQREAEETERYAKTAAETLGDSEHARDDFEQTSDEYRDNRQDELSTHSEADVFERSAQENLEEINRQHEDDLQKQRENEQWQQRRTEARREQQEAEQRKVQAQQRKEEEARRKAAWEETLRKGRERKEKKMQSNNFGAPSTKIERPESLSGLTKKRRRRKNNKNKK